MTQPSMHPQAIAILDQLLRAGLCAPKLWEESFSTLPPLERDETLDALSQGALPLPQVIWEWAGTYGHITPLQRTEFDADLTDFYDALTDLARDFTIQLSTPARDETLGIMPPFPKQRVHLVNRTAWFTLEPSEADETTDEEPVDIPKDLPALTDPGMHVGTQRVGETWIRIAPEELAALRATPIELLTLLRDVADTRVEQLRAKLRTMTFTNEEAGPLNAQLDRITSWQRVLHAGITALEQLPPEARAIKAPGVLAIITSMEAPSDARPAVTNEAPPEDLKSAALRILWKLPRPIRYTLLIITAVVVLLFVVWTSLPDTTKEQFIKHIIK